MRGTVGAIQNDLLNISNVKILIYLGVILMFVVADLFLQTAMNMSREVMLVLITFLLMEGFGESYMSGWSHFEHNMGISTHQRVAGKYILQSAIVLAGFAFTELIYMPLTGLNGINLVPVPLEIYILHLTAAFYYPIIYALNPKKISMVTVAIYAAFILSSLVGVFFIQEILTLDLVVLGFITAGIYIVSYFASVSLAYWHKGRSV